MAIEFIIVDRQKNDKQELFVSYVQVRTSFLTVSFTTTVVIKLNPIGTAASKQAIVSSSFIEYLIY